MIGRDGAGRSAMAAGRLMQGIADRFTVARMILTRAPKNAAIPATHRAMMQPSAALWQSVLVI
jgi:hypothetical protein